MNRIVALLCFAFSVCASAADSAMTRPAPAEIPTYGNSMLPTLGALVLVIAAILITGFFMRRFSPGLRTGGSLIKPISHLQVGPKEKIAVIQFQGELLVLGVTANQITLLTKGTPEAADTHVPTAPTPSALVTKWTSLLRPSQPGQAASPGDRQ